MNSDLREFLEGIRNRTTLRRFPPRNVDNLQTEVRRVMSQVQRSGTGISDYTESRPGRRVARLTQDGVYGMRFEDGTERVMVRTDKTGGSPVGQWYAMHDITRNRPVYVVATNNRQFVVVGSADPNSNKSATAHEYWAPRGSGFR